MFNPLRPVTRKERIIVAAVVGPMAGLIIGILYGLIYQVLNIRIEMSIIFIFLGIALGNITKHFSKGVGKEFIIIGAISGVIMVLVADSFPIFVMLNSFSLSALLISMRINYLLRIAVLMTNFSVYGVLNTILYFLFRIGAIYYAARNSEVGFEGRIF